MKRILMIIAAMAAVLSSCSKSEIQTGSTNGGKDMILNVSVGYPGADTKALIKSGWVADDEISIWYDTNTGATPDLVITYNGTKWIQKAGATVSGNSPSEGEGKYAKALYNGTLKVASKDNYTYADNTLTFNIANWVFLTEIQVVVTGLSGTASNYTLACDKFTPITGNGCTIGAAAITAYTGTKGAAVTGISNTDGVAFVFATADYSTSSTDKQDFRFTLADKTSGTFIAKVYEPNVAIEAKDGKEAIKALTIADTKFAIEYVAIGGLKWASMNLGATTVAGSYETCYGDLYQCGSLETLYDKITYTSATAGSFSWKSGKNSGFVAENQVYNGSDAPLLDDNDVVKQNVGNGWRMPTMNDFTALANACKEGGYTSGDFVPITAGTAESVSSKGIYYCSNYSGSDGIAGLLFCDGTNKLFFPAAGNGDGVYLCNAGSRGHYWSSSTNSSQSYFMRYTNSGVYPQDCNYRNYGFSVRPVSNVN